LADAWNFFLSFDSWSDHFHQLSYFRRALLVPAIVLLVALVTMHVHTRTISTCIRNQNNLPAFADAWLAHNLSNQPRTWLSKAHVTICSFVTTQIEFSSFSEGIHIVNNRTVDIIVLVGRVISVLSSLWGQVVVTQLQRPFDLQPPRVGDAVRNSPIKNRATRLPTTVKGSITTAMNSISNQGCIEMNKFLSKNLFELVAVDPPRPREVAYFWVHASTLV
jgi:hypothetical protein